jgi:nucleotide-binding universal stress UspA family protein
MADRSLGTILLPLSRVDGADALLDAAFGVARRFGAHVRIWHVSPDPEAALHMTGMALPGSARQAVIEVGARNAEEVAAALQPKVLDYCNAHRIPVLDGPPTPDGVSASWHRHVGREGRVVMQRGRLADLIVVPRPDEPTPAPRVLEAALFETGQPVLVVPPRPPEVIGTCVAIGWNGSLVAARAVTAARPFLAAAESVAILCPADGSSESLSAEDLAEELAWHGIVAQVQPIEARGRGAGKAILAAVEQVGADLLVMGGYGKTRTREIILGGATRDVLAGASIPALMVH